MALSKGLGRGPQLQEQGLLEVLAKLQNVIFYQDNYFQAGKLSSRMQAAGNIWQETWESAKPVPARRQKRLFDDTREAEKVIQVK
jgi:hypothetical protein